MMFDSWPRGPGSGMRGVVGLGRLPVSRLCGIEVLSGLSRAPITSWAGSAASILGSVPCGRRSMRGYAVGLYDTVSAREMSIGPYEASVTYLRP